MSDSESFDIVRLLTKIDPTPGIRESQFLQVIPLLTDSMFLCYPSMMLVTPRSFEIELQNRISAWYLRVGCFPYKGQLRLDAVRLISWEYKQRYIQRLSELPENYLSTAYPMSD